MMTIFWIQYLIIFLIHIVTFFIMVEDNDYKEYFRGRTNGRILIDTFLAFVPLANIYTLLGKAVGAESLKDWWFRKP